MTVKVTLEFDTPAEASAFLANVGDLDVDLATGGEAPAPKKRGRPAKAAEVPAPAAPAPAAPAAPAAAPAPTPAPAAPAPAAAALVPYDALKKPLTDLADVDHETAKGILARYGVKKASELKPEQIGPVLAEVQAALTKAQQAPAGLL